MLNIIIILLLISSLINFILNRGKLSPILQCGIWGYFGPGSRYFSKEKFNILGILNDPRGGDGAGFLAGKNVKHLSDKKYIDLIQQWIVPSPKHNVVLGHTRKASSGGKNIEYTQPFCYTRDNKIIGGLVHNGTLYNEEILQSTYKVPKKFIYNDKEYEPNDTQILAYILLHYKNFDVLKDYRGAAALLWEDRDTGLGYVFKGASRKFNYATSDVDSERPLFLYTQEKNRGLWFSSVEDSLWAIASEESPNIEPVKDNTLIIIENGKIIEERFINRTENTQAKDYSNTYYNTNSYNYYNHYYNNKQYKKNNQKSQKAVQLALPIISDSIKSKIGQPIYQYAKEVDRLTAFSEQLQWAAGRYYSTHGADNKAITIRLAHGIIPVDEYGYTGEPNDKDTVPYYFIEGIMIPDHTTYQKVNKLYKKLIKGKFTPKNCTNKTDLEVKKIALLAQFSVYPITNIKSDDLLTSWAYSEDVKVYDGDFNPLFINKKYKFFNGKITEIVLVEWRYPDHSKLKSKPNVSEKNDSSEEIVLIENEFYEYKSNPNTVIQYMDCQDDYGVTVDGSTVYINGEESEWIPSTYLKWLHANDDQSSALTEDEMKWYEETYTEEACRKFDRVMTLLGEIESEALAESAVKTSKTVYKLVENLKQKIQQSELNIN